MDVTLNVLQQIILNVPNYIFWKDHDLIYRGCNKNFATSLGFNDVHELLGKKDQDISWTRMNAATYQEEDLYILTTGQSILGKEVLMSHPDKRDRYLSVSKVPLHDDSGVINGVLGIYIDITQSKETEKILSVAKEKADAANKAKTEFLENMRHDIRTPLTGIVGFSEILKSESSEPHIKQHADNLIASSHALLSLLDEVLEAINVGSGEIPKLKKKFNLHNTLLQVIELHRAKAAQKKINLEFHFDKDLPTYIIGDRVRIQRIALELVSNALNFTEQGAICVSIRLAQQNQRELIVELKVKDSGIGISPEHQQEIYVPFKRLTPSHQGIYKGTGLGLSLVKQFIEELHGEIYVESAPQKGTCFTCLIPLQESLLNNTFGVEEEQCSAKPQETASRNTFTPPNKAMQRGHILIVEDHIIAQNVARTLLNSLGYTVDIAENGAKAIEFWQRTPYDLIFMDIGLPDLDGYEVTQFIRTQELTLNSHTTIVALSAHVGEEHKKQCINAGMDAVLIKPLTLKNCTEIMQKFIPEHQSLKAPYPTTQNSSLNQQQDSWLYLNALPIFDANEGIKTTGNKTLLIEMLRFMINEGLPMDLEEMKLAHQSGDWDKTQQIAHKIKGGALYVGTIKMKMACQYLEHYWKTGQQEHLERLYQQAILVVEETLIEIKQWLNSHPQ